MSVSRPLMRATSSFDPAVLEQRRLERAEAKRRLKAVDRWPAHPLVHRPGDRPVLAHAVWPQHQ
jgi:hypothetical protein